MRKQLIMALAGSIGALGASGMEAATAAEPPKLILALTIDGLRGDIPFRYAERFGAGGFRYLMEQGPSRRSAMQLCSPAATARSTASPATTGTTPAAAVRSTASRTIVTRSSARK